MSLFRTETRALGDSLSEIIPPRGANRRQVTPEQAMHHSGVWGCLRLRADLISTLPVDLYRRVDGVQRDVTKPQVLVTPGALTRGGPLVAIDEWLWASQLDLDRYGNAFGIIMERAGIGLRPSRIDLVAASSVRVMQKDGAIQYWIAGTRVNSFDVWHERQYPVAGLPVGLSPIAYAALTVGQYTSAQEFATAWFTGTAQPAGKLRNTKKVLSPTEAMTAKQRFRDTVAAGDVLVTGNDWEYDISGVPEATSQFLDAQKWSISDVCRFLGVPADMIDAETGGSSITYANISQRVVQLLVTNLGPPVQRRERALSVLTPKPQYVKLNTNALLRLDPATAATVTLSKIVSRTLAPSEARALDDRAPFTPEQIAEFDQLFGVRAPMTTVSPALPVANAAPELARAREQFIVNTPDVRLEPTINVHLPDINLPELRAEVFVNNDPVAPVVTVNVEPTPVTIDVQPAELTVLPTEPKTRKIERDASGEITAVHEE